MKKRPATDHSTKGSRPTAGEVIAAMAVYEQLPRPKKPPSRPK